MTLPRSLEEILAQGDYTSVSKNPDVVQAYLGAGHA